MALIFVKGPIAPVRTTFTVEQALAEIEDRRDVGTDFVDFPVDPDDIDALWWVRGDAIIAVLPDQKPVY